MSSIPIPRQDSPPESWPGVIAGMLIFLSAGLVLILGEVPYEVQPSPRVEALRSLAFWGMLLLPPVGLAIGWIKNFPRWSYPYVTLAVFLSMYIANASTPGLTFFGYPIFGTQIWGLRAFIPPLLAGGIAGLVTRSFRPLGRFFTRMRQDWTVVTYALSGTLPLVILIAYDEMDRAYSLRDMFVLTALMILMALIYLRSRTPRQRGLTLGVGVPLIIGFTAISTTAFWLSLGPENVYIPGMLVWTVILIAFYFLPGIISAWMRSVFSPGSEA